MTWLDSAIGWLSPRAGLDRARARAAMRAVRAYEGAAQTRRTSNWKTSGASANAEIAGGLARLRNRSRDLVRNNPYGRRAIAALVGNAVGTGITLGIANAQVKKIWNLWVREADFFGESDFYGLQALAARANFESGDCLLIRVRTSSEDAGRSGVPLKIKVLEGDYLDTGKQGPLENGNTGIAGIEVDKAGRRVAYHLFLNHPGETAVFSPQATSTRVLAEDVIYLFEKERPGQVLGVPRLSSAIMRVRDLDEYQEALLVKKKIEACFAAFVSTDDDSKMMGASSTTETDADGNSRRVEKLAPGQIIYGRTGESVTFGQPSSSSDSGFTKDALHAIAAGAGCTYEQLTGDLSQVNYSSMRGGRAEFKILVEQYRWLTFVPQVLDRIYAWFEEAASQAGKIRSTGYDYVWTPPRWEYVNPLEDVKADKEELAGGLASLSEKLRARGENPDAVFKEIAEERKRLDELGIEVSYSSKAAAAKPSATEADEDGGEASVEPAKSKSGQGRQMGLFTAMVERALEATTRSIEHAAAAVRSSGQTPVEIHNHLPEPNVTLEASVEAPIVNVAAPDVRVDNTVQAAAPAVVHVDLPAPVVNVENRVNVEKAPVEVNVALPTRVTTSEIERNQNGAITKVTQVEKDA